jgi:hypothetical protein
MAFSVMGIVPDPPYFMSCDVVYDSNNVSGLYFPAPNYLEKWNLCFCYTNLSRGGVFGSQNVTSIPFTFTTFPTDAAYTTLPVVSRYDATDEPCVTCLPVPQKTFMYEAKVLDLTSSTACSENSFNKIEIELRNIKGEAFPIFSGNIQVEFNFFDADNQKAGLVRNRRIDLSKASFARRWN